MALGTLALTACGGGSEDNEDLGSGTAPSAAASSSAAASGGAAPQQTADGVLKIGTLLPQTGSLAFLGPPEFAGVDLAVEELNAAGGILGKPVEKVDSDSGDTSTNIASQSVARLLSQKTDAIVGAASSGVTLTVIDAITSAGVLQISPANTSDQLTDYPDRDLYFRTAPPDVLQGRVLGDQIIADGNQSVGILALQDAYGTGLAKSVTNAVTGSNGEVVETVIYDPKATEFTAEVSKIKAKDPQAIVVIGFDESAKLIQELAKQGIGPQQGKKVYLVDGNTGNALGEKLPKGLLKDVKGTVPGVAAPGNLRARLLKVDPALKDFSYSSEAYDAVVAVALAAEVAKSDSGKDIAAKLVEVTTGGTKCTTITACLEAARAGTDFDYDGVSGPIEFNAKGDPTQASIGVYTFGADNKLLAKVEYKSGKI
ncbi:MAG: amino acid transporter substrate-binding protein [Frankiales bacterium]|jgi:ABC-type branched-subunit amino acid transport system substrate-binding protein|nr:amino acid transporter substrate-binding protein [Frankiales bacterium]